MDKNVEALATLLGEKPEVVKEAFEDEAKFNGLIDQYKEKFRIFTPEEFTKTIDNSNREYIETLGTDGKQIPSNIYNYVKGNAFDKKEKEWAKEHEIESWKDIDDLNSQIIAKKTAKSGSAGNDELIKERAETKRLKELVLKSDEEKVKAVAEEKGKIGARLINLDVVTGINSVDIDADEGEMLDTQRELLEAKFRHDHTLEWREVDGKEQTVVLKNGDLQKNKVGDPLSVIEVLADFAPKYVKIKAVPSGGRGGSSTTIKTKGIEGISNMTELAEYAEGKDIKQGSVEFLSLMEEVSAANPDFKN